MFELRLKGFLLIKTRHLLLKCVRVIFGNFYEAEAHTILIYPNISCLCIILT